MKDVSTFTFTLPVGISDGQGELQRLGMMRRATALDEIEAANDPRILKNEHYLSMVLLSRVIVQLGNQSVITPVNIEQLYAVDFAYLQELYVWLNDANRHVLETACPICGHRFALDLMSSHHDTTELESDPANIG